MSAGRFGIIDNNGTLELVDQGSKTPSVVAHLTTHDHDQAWNLAAVLNEGDLGRYDDLEPF